LGCVFCADLGCVFCVLVPLTGISFFEPPRWVVLFKLPYF
jgi:hypothetical protein